MPHIISSFSCSQIHSFFIVQHPWNLTYESKHDTFRHVTFAILPCIVLALIFNQANYSRGIFEIFFEVCLQAQYQHS